MNEIVKKFLLAGDTFMPEMRWRQPGTTHSTSQPFTKNRKTIQKFYTKRFTIYSSNQTS